MAVKDDLVMSVATRIFDSHGDMCACRVPHSSAEVFHESFGDALLQLCAGSVNLFGADGAAGKGHHATVSVELRTVIAEDDES